MSTLENLEYTAAIVCNRFWHCFTSSVHNYGVIYVAQALKL